MSQILKLNLIKQNTTVLFQYLFNLINIIKSFYLLSRIIKFSILLDLKFDLNALFYTQTLTCAYKIAN